MREDTRVAKQMEKDIREVCRKRQGRFCAKYLCSECKIQILAELGYRRCNVEEPCLECKTSEVEE